MNTDHLLAANEWSEADRAYSESPCRSTYDRRESAKIRLRKAEAGQTHADTTASRRESAVSPHGTVEAAGRSSDVAKRAAGESPAAVTNF